VIKVCSWCRKEIPEESDGRDGRISHGICGECRDYFFPCDGKPPTLSLFLDRFDVPVILLDRECRAVFVNREAGTLLGTKAGRIGPLPAGDAIECVHAREPEGCGGTAHCKSCTIRRTVMDTFATGRSHVDQPAFVDSGRAGGGGRCRYFITTILSGGFVFLKIVDRLDLAAQEGVEREPGSKGVGAA